MATTILVSGGAGFIGSSFVLQCLRESDHYIVVVDKLAYAGSSHNLRDADPARHELVQADIGDQAVLLQSHAPVAVINFGANDEPVAIEEKPRQPKSSYTVTGLYFYDNSVIDIARGLKPSACGELEITDVNNAYLQRGTLRVEKLGRGFAWLDTGTHESLLEASQYVQTIERRQGLKVACLEEIGFNNGWLLREDLLVQARALQKTDYGQYLLRLAGEMA